MPKIIKCEFTSVWDDGAEVTTPCKYNPATGEVVPEISKGDAPIGMLEEEYITLPNGKRIDVCTDCHSYVMKTEMVEDVGKQLVEDTHCSNPDCDGLGEYGIRD